MRNPVILMVCATTLTASAADLESRALTHYIPQDSLESIVRKDEWTEIVLKPFGGVRKGDKARIWAGGMIDRGGADQPGQKVNGPAGLDGKDMPTDPTRLALSPDAAHAFAILFKTDDGKIHRCAGPGQPLEFSLVKEGGRLWIGYNDLRGQYNDNHLGKGRRFELDPAWVRVEVIRIVTD